MKNLTMILLLTTMLFIASEITSAPIETISAPLSNNTNDQSNNNQDSHLEHVHVKQETGFDGKVRSIRFGLELEKNQRTADKDVKSEVGDDNSKVDSVSSSNLDTSSAPSDLNTLPLTKDEISTDTKSSISKRSVEQASSNNEHDDLVAEEAKVFRPLFVYRQQVAKRLKLRNDRRSDFSFRPKPQRTNNYGYYYPYHYPYNYPYYGPYRTGFQ